MLLSSTASLGRLFVRLPEPREWIEPSERDERLYLIRGNLPPWHHVDLFYNLPKKLASGTFEDYTIDVDINENMPLDINLYICVVGGHTNLGGFYAGFQTQVGCPGDSLGQEPVSPAPGLIFSRWGPTLKEDVEFTSSESFREMDTYEGN